MMPPAECAHSNLAAPAVWRSAGIAIPFIAQPIVERLVQCELHRFNPIGPALELGIRERGTSSRQPRLEFELGKTIPGEQEPELDHLRDRHGTQVSWIAVGAIEAKVPIDRILERILSIRFEPGGAVLLVMRVERFEEPAHLVGSRSVDGFAEAVADDVRHGESPRQAGGSLVSAEPLLEGQSESTRVGANGHELSR